MRRANLMRARGPRNGRRSGQSTRSTHAAQWRRLVAFAALLVAIAGHISVAIAQSAAIIRPTSDASDRLRLATLAGDTTAGQNWMLRSPSMYLRARHDSSAANRIRWLVPTVNAIVNSATPYSLNDGAMWAGRGVSVSATGGLDFHAGRFHAIVAPEMWVTANARFDRNRDPYKFYTPHPPVLRYGDGFADPWYVQPYSADLPWRLGSSALGRGWFGQSGAWYDAGPLEFGATTENMWWGPGVRNAILMSDNAAGIPRLELRTPRAWRTRIGAFEGRWLVGALSESQYFDTTKTDDVRSIAAAAVTWRPSFEPTLTLGVARAVYATASGYGAVPFRWFDVFAGTGHAADPSPSDSSLYPGGREQLTSLFARWIFPADGFEAYAEWARQELPRSFHDFIVDPTHSHGYTLGVQYRKPAPPDRTTFRIQGEVTTLEQSGDFKNRPTSVFYTSRRVIQGYTEFGQPIGAAIGPGASSQWLAWDRVWSSGSYGVTFTRIRWNEDVRSNFNWVPSVSYCNHDVSVLPGVRGGHSVGTGYISGELIAGNRYNAFFQSQSGCPTGGPSKIDLHPVSISISFTPFVR